MENNIVNIHGDRLDKPKVVLDPKLTHIGRFGIPVKMLRLEFDTVMALMKDVVIIDANNNHETGVIEYTGVSPILFDIVEEGHLIPIYDIGLRIDGIWEFHRREGT